MRNNAFDSVMPTGTAFLADSDSADIKTDVVEENDYILRLYFIIICCRTYTFTAEVHVCERLE